MATLTAFTTSFSKCKLMVQSCFFEIDIESLYAHIWDESMLAIAGDAVRMIMEIAQKHAYQANVIPQTRVIQYVDDKDDDNIGILLHITKGPSWADAGPSYGILKLK